MIFYHVVIKQVCVANVIFDREFEISVTEKVFRPFKDLEL